MKSVSDARLAERLASEAGAILIDLQRRGDLDGRPLGAAGDAAANAFLMRAIAVARPDDAVLCEEEKDNLARLDAARVWIIDPLDGTREYGEGRSDWAVHVALAIDGVPVAGAVALPALGVTMSTAAPPPLRAPNDPLRMVVSRTRPAAEAIAVAKALGAKMVPMGSAGAKAMAVVRGDADIYLHSGGQFEWDSCAPVAVAAAAGLHISRANGDALVYNRRDTYMPDLLICRAELASAVLEQAAQFRESETQAASINRS